MGLRTEKTKVGTNKSILTLPIKDILPGDNPREKIDPVAMGELMQSMKHNGLLSPVGVRVLPTTGKYKLVYGHRRHLAAAKLGWDTIEAIQVDVNDEKDALVKTSTENVIRESISLPETGRGFSALLKKGLNAEEIAVRMGCSKAFVNNALEAFNRIPKRFHEKISFGTRGQSGKEGMIPATVALRAVEIKRQNKGITENDVGRLMDWAAKNRVNVVRMRTAGNMIAAGTRVEKAIEQVDYMKSVSLTVTMKIATIQKLQRKYDMSIHDILYKFLQENEEFGVLPMRLERMSENELPREVVRKARKRRNR